MNSHVGIEYKFWFSLKGHPNYIVVISKRPDMWVFHLGLGLHLRLLKSPMGYIETNLNMDIAFMAYLLPFGNIFKLGFSFSLKIYKMTLHCFTYV
jgi:hypothetical protein